jgi:hypothetical protein
MTTRKPSPLTKLKGMFGRPAKTVSIDEMSRAIAKRGATANQSTSARPEEGLATRDSDDENKNK